MLVRRGQGGDSGRVGGGRGVHNGKHSQSVDRIRGVGIIAHSIIT